MRYVVGAVVVLIVVGFVARALRGRGGGGGGSRLAPLPKPVPAAPGAPTDDRDAVAATYMFTSVAGDPGTRISARGLGRRGDATVSARPDGVVIARQGASVLFVPTRSLDAVRRVGGTDLPLVAVAWTHRGRRLETVVRPRRVADAALLHDRLSTLVEGKDHR